MSNASPRRLIPASKWHLHHAWPSSSGLRNLILKARKNGFHEAVRRVGRRVLIDEAAFFAWVDNQGGRRG
jgi:hypothetical protein